MAASAGCILLPRPWATAPWRLNAPAVPAPPPDPEVFDYDRWLGQAPWEPYSETKVKLWRLNWDTSAGPVADMGPHYCEFAQWARGDEATGPVEYEGAAEFRSEHQLITSRTSSTSAPGTPTARVC